MKALSAKFPGYCRACKRRFPAGTEINWGASEGSEHRNGCPACVTCPAATGHEASCPEAEQKPQTFHRGVYFQARSAQDAQSPTWKQDTFTDETNYDLSDIELGGRGTSYFAIPFDGEGAYDKHWFARIDKPKADSKWAGNLFVKWVYGDVEKSVGRQFPGESFRFRKGQERFDYPLNELWADPEKAKALYGQLIGKCGNCHKRLTDETSRKFGIGPECRKMLKYWQTRSVA